MEPAALDIIDGELAERGYLARDVEEHGRIAASAYHDVGRRGGPLQFLLQAGDEGSWPGTCFGPISLWPRYFRYCDDHRLDRWRRLVE